MYPHHDQHAPATRFRCATATVVVLALAVAACGTDDADGTISRSAWVDQFDRVCAAVTDELSDTEPAMTDAEFVAFNIGAVTVLRALPMPDEDADTAQALLDDLLLGPQSGFADEEMAEIEQRIYDSMSELGVSDECIGGVPG